MEHKTFFRILIALAVYFGLTYFGGDVGRKILYPIRLLVTFLHEFGHAFGALVTGGDVRNLQVNSDGSGYTITVGGSRAIILLGGYIGSAVFGNLLLYVGARKPQISNVVLLVLCGVMVLSGLFWFNSFFTTGLLLLFAVVLGLVALKTGFASDVLMFLGLTSILYIIQDFNVGPRSDLQKYAEIFVLIPTQVWMYVWLAIALLLSVWNLQLIFRKKA